MHHLKKKKKLNLVFGILMFGGVAVLRNGVMAQCHVAMLNTSVC